MTRFFSMRLLCLLLLSTLWLMLHGCTSSPQMANTEPATANVTKSSPIADVNGSAYSAAEQDAIRQQFAQSVTLIQGGHHEQAKKILHSLQEKYPHLAGIYVNLAMISWHEGDEKQARALNAQALEFNKNNADAWVFEGIMNRVNGDFIAAEKAYRAAIAVDPANKNAWMNLGFLKDLYQGEQAEALKCYAQYAQLNPQDTRVKNWVIDLQRRMEGG